MKAGEDVLRLDRSALDHLMPLHVQLGECERICHSGPTFGKLMDGDTLVDKPFFEMFELLRPMGVTTIAGLKKHRDVPLKLRLKKQPDLSLRGVMIPAAEGLLLNISFGLSLVDAVRRFNLTNDDFAPTDMAIELLYLVEAKSAAYDESRRLNARLSEARNTAERQAKTDMLTGLKNRRALVDALAEQTERGALFTLMHVDLDHFKEVNDQLGHAAGDHVLRHVADVLLKAVRGSDVVARIGGDEFVLLLHRLSDPEHIAGLSGRIIAQLEEPIPFRDAVCRVSASIGTTVSSHYADINGDRMLRDADAALYLSKREGRGRATHVTEQALQDDVFAKVLQPEAVSSVPNAR